MDAIAPAPLLSDMDNMKTPTKNRSISDPPNITSAGPANMLAPSPTFRERIVNVSSSKDDHDAYPTTPKASRRPLSLQMPPSLSMPSPSQFPSSSQARYAAPLSPQLDRNNIYSGLSALSSQQSSPATSLPRHSRGLDFSRASTNLHHSTLAERNICGGGSSPDASPIVGLQKPMWIPGRNSRKGSVSSMVLDSPNIMSSGVMPWGAANERSAVSSSVGSVNMLASESSDSDSDGDAEDASMGGEDNVDEDPIFTTPQVHKLQNPNAPTPFTGAPSTPGGGDRPGSLWGTGHNFSPAQASLMRTIRRSRLHKGNKNKRKSSSSASNSGYSSLNSPRNTSPPPLRSIESATNGGGGYFNSNWPTAARSRRESLALGTDGLHLSSGNDSGDEASASNNANTPSTPGVVRRAVTRRGNLLPKTKGFARIRAALLEEAAPIDTDVRQEAETIRQVRERDGRGSIGGGLDLTPNINRTRDEAIQQDPSSPTMLPAVPEGIQSSDFVNSDDSAPKGLALNFSTHASRNGAGLDYWNRYDSSFRTPPPPPNFARQSSSVISDMNIDSAPENNPINNPGTWRPRPRARSSASDAPSEATMQSATQPSSGQIMSDDIHLNRFKRRREDDFDISTIKRRAVSPGMGGGGGGSANNSPILTQSPTLKEATSAGSTAGGGGSWGNPPERKTSLDKLSNAPVSASSDVSTSALPPPLSASTTASTVPSAAPSRHGSGGSVMSLASNSTALGLTNSGGSGGGPNGSAPGSAPGSSSGTGGTGPGGGKKLGLQGMVDTNDGLMKMSIE